MQASTNCARFIASFEGGQSRDALFHPYFDRAGGLWTIGYGHTEGVSAHSKPLTLKEAKDLLLKDLNTKYAPAVDEQLHAYKVRRLLGQDAFDALCSFTFNLGSGELGPSHTIGQKLKAHDLHGAADAILLYDRAANGSRLLGLTRRRHAERDLFLKGIK